MRDGEHSDAALLKRPVGTVMTAVIGLVVATLSLFVFVLDLLVTPEIAISDLIVSFVVCGVGLTTGLFLLRSLVPRRDPISLFAGAVGEPVEPTAQAETRTPAGQLSRNYAAAAIAMPPAKKPDSIGNSHRQSISRYKARESSGALVFVTAIGVSLVLGGRLRGGWEFLSLAMPVGCVVALVLYWGRNRRASNISGYKIPVAGGVIGAAALTGMGLVMVRFPFLRDFLGLAILAGGAIALGLNWSRRRRENSSSSFV